MGTASFICWVVGANPALGAPKLPPMKAETSHWTETGRAEESEKLCLALARAYPRQVRCQSMGTSPHGRTMRVLVVSGSGVFSPDAAKKKGLPVVWIQAGIHAGEIEGKDATYHFLKTQLALPSRQSVLGSQVILFCPILNIDGHERFGKWNRANQNGPLEMGWRVNSQNLNLNRDYAKLDTPEVEASLRFMEKWNPDVWVDLHTTDGAKFQHDVALVLPSTIVGQGNLKTLSLSLQDRLMSGLTRKDHQPLWFYPEFLKADDPMSGIEHYPDSPKMGYAYFAYRNRIGILVETHSWKNYEHRAIATEHVLEELTADIAARGKEYVKTMKEADEAATKLAGQVYPLAYQVKGEPENYDFLGYEYQVLKSDVSGQNWIRYDDQKPTVWKIPLWTHMESTKTAVVPTRGYWVDADVAPWVAAKLSAHGIRFEKLKKPLTGTFEVFRASKIDLAAQSVEGHVRATWTGAWKSESLEIPAGSLFVPSAQPRIGMAMYLFEPSSGDSFASWGMLNHLTEQKEYVEDYVLEEFAREKLQDPEIEKAFREKLKSDAEFEKSPEKRLWFFYELHPAFDPKYRRLPFFRG